MGFTFNFWESKHRMYALLLVLLYGMASGCKKSQFYYAKGEVYGTYYSVSYDYTDDLNTEIKQQMDRVDRSLSMYNKNSVIAKLNRGESDAVDELFERMFSTATRVSKISGGAFDITVAPLVNAWGFGYKEAVFPSQQQIDSLLQFVGMDKLRIVNGRLVKSTDKTEMDASAIAKGLGVDVVAEYLESKGIDNYLVEIGGEVRVKGYNHLKQAWRIGIEKPVEDAAQQEREYKFVVHMTKGALATSGNYRKFYYHEGKRYGHTIDPRTGYPIQTEILSASVYAKNCMEADAFATVFMVSGLEASKKIVAQNKDVEVCFIYEEQGVLTDWMSEGFKKLLSEK